MSDTSIGGASSRGAGKPQRLGVLLLGVSIGTGHQQTNAALVSALQQDSQEREVWLDAHQADALDYFSAFETCITAGMYDLWLRYMPAVYSFYYNLTDKPSTLTPQIFGRFGRKAMRHDLRTLEPQVVVSSFPTLATLALQGKPRGQRFLNVLILTDYRVHHHWARPEADLICVPTQQAAQQMRNCGIAAHKVAVTGIPIDARYTALQACLRQDQGHKVQLRRKYGLEPDVATLLISGGGTGKYRAAQEVLEVLSHLGQRVQVLVLAGAKRRGVRRVGGATFHELGFTPNFPELLALSDLVVGKAGGLTVAEATALGVPMVIYRPIPGQEEHNAAFLVQQQAAYWAQSLHELRALILRALDPSEYAKLSAAALALGRVDAAKQVSEVIWQRLQRCPQARPSEGG